MEKFILSRVYLVFLRHRLDFALNLGLHGFQHGNMFVNTATNTTISSFLNSWHIFLTRISSVLRGHFILTNHGTALEFLLELVHFILDQILSVSDRNSAIIGTVFAFLRAGILITIAINDFLVSSNLQRS
jgi:hypothetical protein